MKTGKQGFTLTELLVVVMIIAILVSIGVPLYSRTVRKGYAGDAMSVLSTAAQKQESYYINNGKYAEGFTQLGAPVKGLDGDKSTSSSGVKVGNFKYQMSDSCVSAVSLVGDAASDADDYVLYKNFVTQQEGCVGKGCEILEGVIDHVSSVGCPAVSGETTNDDPPDVDDPCVTNPVLCCPADTTWNGTKCVGMECSAGKVYDSLHKECVCSVSCVSGLGTQNSVTCVCTCTNICKGGQVKDDACNCYCPSSLPNWDATNAKCIQACAAPKTRWDSVAGQCVCPLEKPLFTGSGCVSCPMAKPWNDSTKTCSCPSELPYEWNDGKCRACSQSSAAAPKAACLSTAYGPAGIWIDVMCSCDCQQQNSIYSNGSCVCPPAKPVWKGSLAKPAPTFKLGTARNAPALTVSLIGMALPALHVRVILLSGTAVNV
jgi:prepilin-type N-terminal cleavage/methylation domain-containing protein